MFCTNLGFWIPISNRSLRAVRLKIRKRSLLSMIPLSRNLPLCLNIDGKTMRSRENNFFGFFLRRLSRSKVRILTNHFGKLKTQPKIFDLERSHSFSVNFQRYLELSVCSLDRYRVPSWMLLPDWKRSIFWNRA